YNHRAPESPRADAGRFGDPVAPPGRRFPAWRRLRRSIKAGTALLLGALSILLFLGGYTCLAGRQARLNPDDTTLPRWGQMAKGFANTIEVNKPSKKCW